MKTIYLLLAGFLTWSGVRAQDNVTPVGAFTYQLTSENFSAVCDLFCQGNQSAFVLYDKDVRQVADTTMTSRNGNNLTMVRVNVSDGNDFVLYKNYQTQQMISRELLLNGRKCIVTDSVPSLAWTFTGEKKQIGPYACQKATTLFRCATYVAWFTTAIPLPYGPWKMGGLPGLIVEVTNEKIALTYRLIAARYPASGVDTSVISRPDTADPAYTFADFASIQQRELKKVKAFLLSKSGDPVSGQFSASMPECYTNH